MALVDVLLGISEFIVVAIAMSLVGVVGVDRLATLTRTELRERFQAVLPYLLFLGIVLALTAVIRENSTDISWMINFRLGPLIHNIEGEFVAWVQSFRTPLATDYFVAVYIHGYVYLLVFPFFAYALADDLKPFRLLILSYTFNYVIGVLLYILFISFGPRNYVIGESLLYSTWPDAQFLTFSVNVNVNVFPSLHAAMSTTVALLSVRTRDIYPQWPPIAVPLAASVCIATMYLAIHWATDVVAGIVLAAVSIWLAERLHDRFATRVEQAWGWLLTVLQDLRQRLSGDHP